MPRITLSALQADGTPHWVDLRELRVARGDRKRVLTYGNTIAATMRAAEGDPTKVDDQALEDSGFDFLDALIFYWVLGWSLTRAETVDAPPDRHGEPLPLPKDDPSVLESLDLEIGAEIEEALDPVAQRMSGRRVSASDMADAQSPSVPSRG